VWCLRNKERRKGKKYKKWNGAVVGDTSKTHECAFVDVVCFWVCVVLLLLFHLTVGYSNFCGETSKKIPILVSVLCNFDNHIQSFLTPPTLTVLPLSCYLSLPMPFHNSWSKVYSNNYNLIISSHPNYYDSVRFHLYSIYMHIITVIYYCY